MGVQTAYSSTNTFSTDHNVAHLSLRFCREGDTDDRGNQLPFVSLQLQCNPNVLGKVLHQAGFDGPAGYVSDIDDYLRDRNRFYPLVDDSSDKDLETQISEWEAKATAWTKDRIARYNKEDAGSNVLLTFGESKVDLEGDTRMKGLHCEVKDRSVERVCDAHIHFLLKLDEELSKPSGADTEASEASDSVSESSDED